MEPLNFTLMCLLSVVAVALEFDIYLPFPVDVLGLTRAYGDVFVLEFLQFIYVEIVIPCYLVLTKTETIIR